MADRARRKPDEVGQLVKHARVRNVLLEAVGRRGSQAQLREAAMRVVRLSDPGTPERFFTLTAVSEDTGIASGKIVAEICAMHREGSNG